ncbi:unnamed protein product [Cuscuta campestris]|uniref:Uncharacterized protein n=1 Tax=Cuscuta campestris TaxID=132261 RepID=A0A484LAV9_9ASTE|nr:unnamed protein product [Cuscuta campestris]
MQLEHQFRTTSKGSLSMVVYCQTLRNLADSLDDVDATVSEQQLLLQVLRGLPDDLRAQTSFLQYQTPPLTFLQTRSALLLIEQQRADLGVGSIGGDNGKALYAGSGGPDSGGSRRYDSAGGGRLDSSGGGSSRQLQHHRQRGGQQQFTRDNNCSIEFESTGFSVKDMLTGTLIHRSNNVGPLYPMSQTAAHAQAQAHVATGSPEL